MAAQPTAAGWILRMGSTAGIVGALLGLVGNLLHPATPPATPPVARAIADSQLWVPDHLAIVLGLILVLGGLVAIARSIQGGLPGALARLGSVAAVAGVTVGASTWWPRRPGRQAARRGLGNRATAGTSGRAAAGSG